MTWLIENGPLAIPTNDTTEHTCDMMTSRHGNASHITGRFLWGNRLPFRLTKGHQSGGLIFIRCQSEQKKSSCRRSETLWVNNITSEKNACYVGVPQGSILGPLLFLLYVNDLPQYVQNQNCNIFADDTIIYSVGSNAEDISNKLQGTLDTIMPWYMSNRLSINANKSAVMLIGKPSQIFKMMWIQR